MHDELFAIDRILRGDLQVQYRLCMVREDVWLKTVPQYFITVAHYFCPEQLSTCERPSPQPALQVTHDANQNRQGSRGMQQRVYCSLHM